MNTSKYPYSRWTDYKINEDKFVREIGEYKYTVEKGQILWGKENIISLIWLWITMPKVMILKLVV